MPAGRPNELKTILCPGCGREFRPRRAISKYCTMECAHQYQHKAFRAMVARLLDEGLPESALAARKAGADYYFTGKVCSNGHLTIRSVKNQICVECHHQRRQKECRDRKAQRQPVHRDQPMLSNRPFMHILPNWQAVVA